MDTAHYEMLRKNVLDAKASIVPSQEADANALIDLLDEREQQAGRGRAGIAWPVVDGLRLGIRSAPRGTIVFHERLQMLQLFDAIDLLGDAAPPAISPEPAPPQPVGEEI